MARQNDNEPSQILEHVYLGCRAHARDKDLLQRLCITHILNVTPPKTMDPVAGVPNFFEKDKMFIYRRCPIFDTKAEDISSVLEGCIAFMDQAKYHGRILVHCNKGISRSSSMVVAYLMKRQSRSFEHALAFVVARHPLANPNASFRRQLLAYERHLPPNAPKPAPPLLPPARNKNPASIGPHLPPSLQETPGNTEQGNFRHDRVETENHGIIGPSLPPSSRKRPRTHADSTVALKQVTFE